MEIHGHHFILTLLPGVRPGVEVTLGSWRKRVFLHPLVVSDVRVDTVHEQHQRSVRREIRSKVPYSPRNVSDFPQKEVVVVAVRESSV